MAEDEEDEYREDPDFLYNLRGGFDDTTYEDELEHFPEHFDENGWPLFGEYDLYALKHPITGLVWHKAPRVPRDDETDPDYEDWFHLAQQYQSTLNKIYIGRRATPIYPVDNPQTKNNLYKTGAKYAVAGNLAYLKEHILPILETDFIRRSSSPEFALNWGEFVLIGENLETSFQITKRREQGRIGGKKNKVDRSPQLKWYLHWHHYNVDNLGQTKKKADENFVTLAWRLYNGEIPLPSGFVQNGFPMHLVVET